MEKSQRRISAHVERLTSNQNTRSEPYFTRAVSPRKCFTIVRKRTQVYRCHESPSHLKKTKKTKEKRGPVFPRCLENKGIRIFFSYIMTKIKTEPTKGGMRCGGRSTSNPPTPLFFLRDMLRAPSPPPFM